MLYCNEEQRNIEHFFYIIYIVDQKSETEASEFSGSKARQDISLVHNQW